MRALILIFTLGCRSSAVTPVSPRTEPAAPAAPVAAVDTSVVLERTSFQLAEPVGVRLTGRFVVDGDCHPRPEFALEQQVGRGWEERIAMPTIQMTCGPPEVDWVDQHVDIPLAGKVEAGTYRLVFAGANKKLMRSAPFEIK